MLKATLKLNVYGHIEAVRKRIDWGFPKKQGLKVLYVGFDSTKA